MRAAFAVLLVFVSAGCVTPAATPAQTQPPLAAVLEGFVLDEESRPVPGASVTAGDAHAASDASGAYRFADLASGRVLVRATHPDFAPTALDVVLGAGAHQRRDITLVRLPVRAVFNETFPFHGRFDCAWDFVILGGDCLVLYRNLTGEDDPVTDEAHAFRLPVRAGWSQVTLNVSWQDAAENQLEGMRLYLEHGNGSTHGHATSVAQAEGATSPVQLIIQRGVVHPQAERYENTQTKARLSEAGEELQIRVFPRGRLSQELGTVCHEGKCFLGIGGGLEIDFDVAARVTYAP